MVLELYNTLTRKKEQFKPLSKDKVGFYSCGPTVYWTPHIGNLRAYVFGDTLKRVLEYNGYTVTHVMNYTDVGHLTSDADEGEDKVELAAKKEGKTAQEITAYYIKEFDDSTDKLNIKKPSVTCKATDYITEMIDLINILEQKGYTYKTEDGIYFDTEKVSDYGKMANLNKEGLLAGRRTDMRGKRSKTDFALWKFSETPGKRQQEWDSPWGLGFPGWHSECVVMSVAHLGKQFDIHTGGEDHIQVHHTNEIAQAETAYDVKPWVRYWLHNAFLTFQGEKVSKSKGGLYTIADLEKKGFDPLVYRYFCLGTHYRKPLNFSLETLEGAKNSYTKLSNAVIELKTHDDSNTSESYVQYKNDFLESINDDLNTAKALALLWEVIKDKELGSKEKLEIIIDFDRVLGLGINEMKEECFEISSDVQKLIDEREKARNIKDYKTADKIREDLYQKGYELIDTDEGVRVKKIS